MSTKRHHAEWLSLVEVSGPFLTMPVLEKVFAQGLDAHDPDHVRGLRRAHEEWEDNQAGRRPNPAVHNAWMKFVLTQTLGLPDEVLAEGQSIPQTLKATVSEHGEVLRPDLVVRNPEGVPDAGKGRLLVQCYPLSQNLDKPVAEHRWKASPATRMMELLHATDVRLGLVTNGDHWMLVDAPRGETTGFASWYANLWLEEPLTLRAFRSLLGVHRFFSVPANETLEAMMAESASHQQEVTDQLGYQVRRAVEVLIQSLDRADQDDKVLAGVPEPVLYEAALTVMMRLVFLFSAEERELLLLGDPLYDQHYAVSTLVAQLQEAADQHGEEVLERRPDAWCRLLSTFRAVYGGVQHERLKLPAYAGHLFDPDRFPFLEGRQKGTSWRDMPASPLPVNNRTVLHLLRSLQFLELQGEARRLSFRALDIEQIGHVYEGLLDHTAKRATEPVLGLLGAKGKEPEVLLADLEKHKDKGEADLIKFLREETGRSESALRRGLEPVIESDETKRLRAVCGNDDALFKRVRPFVALIRDDSFGRPVVVRKGSVFVTSGTDRRSSGTHYTPRSLTEPIVQYTLEPLVYVGPAEGTPKEEWKLRPVKELLNLKICDMACGSGAFLVQACRYLSELVVEAWDQAEADHPGVPGITPDGDPSTGAANEQLIPNDQDERLIYARRIIAQRCLYGVDKNPLAAEMAKLSLWLLTLAKDKPFEFLDHAIRSGDSLVGIHNTEQLRKFNLDGTGDDHRLFLQFLDERIPEAIALRRQIAEMQSNTVEDVEAQDRLLREANEKIDRLKCAADMLISAEFVAGSAADKRAARDDAAIKVAVHFNDSDLTTFRREVQRALAGQTPFHWPLEFPEVMVERGGFDAFAGNPPFKGGAALGTLFGASWRDFVVRHIGKDVRTNRGQYDLCVFFFLRACQLKNRTGVASGIATNSFAQGDSKTIGLAQLCATGFEVIRALNDVPWPGDAATHVCLTWIAHSPWLGEHWLDGRQVDAISDSLSDDLQLSEYYPLMENKGVAFRGAMPYGEGFFISMSEARSLLQADSANSAVLMPYLIGDDINSTPTQEPSRYIINFRDWPLTKVTKGHCAADYPAALKIVEDRVKPQRLALPANNSTAKHRIKFWWQFSNRADDLLDALKGLQRALAISRTTAHLAFSFVPVENIVHSERLVVIADDSWDTFGIVQSTIHEEWACRPGMMTHETRKTYFVKEAFCTFPRPLLLQDVASIACAYYEHRLGVMRERQEGLTDTYNRFHDPEETSADIQELRQLHVEMDNTVAAAYGWTDLDLGHGFHEAKQGVRYTISEPARREVLGRLLKLNHERYAEEVKQGLHDKKGKAGGRRAKRTAKSAAQPGLFGDSDEDEPGGQNGEAKKSKPSRSTGKAVERLLPIEEFSAEEVMAAFRQSTRGRGWMERDDLLKAAAESLGYKRLGSKIDTVLRGHLRAAIRRKIIAADGPSVRAETSTMAEYTLDELREAICSVMRKGTNYDRENVIQAVAGHLGFARVTDSVRQAVKSAINSGIRQGVLGYEGDLVWRL